MVQEPYRSNITIASNVYIRTNPNITRDPQFVHHVTGPKALKELESHLFGATNGTALMREQSDAMLQSAGCAYNRRGDQPYGPVLVDGAVTWACRCENKICKLYSSCINKPYAKEIFRIPLPATKITTIADYDTPLQFSYLGGHQAEHQISGADIFAPVEAPPEWEPLQEDVIPIASPAIFMKPDEEKYLKISSPTPIIEAPITESIRVNAGPGTGKTYTVIQRLTYIMKNRLADPENILVLCYTRAAVTVIRNRLEASIESGELDFRSRQINICTLDSLATQALTVMEVDVAGLDYTQRIVQFNEAMDEELFQDFSYVITDEIQDLVNQRAIMALKILDAIDCAFLLLGDSCQAIYDYSTHDESCMDSRELYQKLDQLMPPDARYYELTRNMRQTECLSCFTDDLRQVLLSYSVSDANSFIESEIQSIDCAQDYAENFTPKMQKGKSTAILCRNNGEAECMSGILWNRGIDHTLLRSTAGHKTYQRWIADVFWDYCEDAILRDTFIQRYCIRVTDDVDEATTAFLALASLCSDDASQVERISMDVLHKALCQHKDGTSIFWNEEDTALTVSTIHKSKGCEYDYVYLMDSPFATDAETTEEARVWYVAATRAKEQLLRIQKKNKYNWYMGKTKGQRPYRTQRKKKTFYCNQLTIGYDGDFQEEGFLRIDMREALTKQEYIATNVKPKDKVELIWEQNHYVVKRENASGAWDEIGLLSQEATEDIRSAVSIRYCSELPKRLYNIHIKNIYTVVRRSVNDDIPLRYRKSRIWLGIEMTGFAKIDWHYER